MALWTPSKLPDLFAWYDADALSLSNNDLISTLADSSGNGYSLTASGAARPQFKTNIFNSRASMLFSGSQHLTSSVTSPWNFLHKSGGSAIFAVWQAGTVSDPNVVYYLLSTGTAATSQNALAIRYDDRSSASINDSINTFAANSTATRPFFNQSANNAHSSNTAVVVTALYDAGNATASLRSELRVNGGAAIENNTLSGTPSTSNASAPFRIGALSDGSLALVGYVSEVIACDAVVTLQDSQYVEGYLAHKWGLASSLPNDHPYKSVAPTYGSSGSPINGQSLIRPAGLAQPQLLIQGAIS
jgi:hypothetical protein